MSEKGFAKGAGQPSSANPKEATRFPVDQQAHEAEVRAKQAGGGGKGADHGKGGGQKKG